jgi:hypothetical protein
MVESSELSKIVPSLHFFGDVEVGGAAARFEPPFFASIGSRFARSHICKKYQLLSIFEGLGMKKIGLFYVLLVYFMSIRRILGPFGIFCVNWYTVYFSILL